MDQGLENIVAVLGVLKSGKFYVSLDIRDPDEKYWDDYSVTPKVFITR